MKNLKTQLAVLLLSTLGLFTGAHGQAIPSGDDAKSATYTVLHSFDGKDGFQPYGAMIQGTNGNLYGQTSTGGAKGAGTIFTITPSGTFTSLHSFDGTDGSQFYGQSLVQGTNGDFYGTTYLGGAHTDGTVFKMTPSGKLTTLHSFDGTDGDGLLAGLVQATDGNLYGTTADLGPKGDGTVFEITPSGTVTTLHSFDGTDGGPDVDGLILASDGDFYGTTGWGGNYSSSCSSFGCGTIFKITPSGELTTLYKFCPQSGCPDGQGPAGLVQVANGNFYGTTSSGGNLGGSCPSFATSGCGTFFEITPSGTFTTLYKFCSQSKCKDGFSPTALIQATDGNFYGTNFFGGANCAPDGCGTIFKITPHGKLTTLYSFCPKTGCADGEDPTGLVQDTNGMFYGTAEEGASNAGTVFSLSVGLSPFVKTQPTSGKAGAAVTILGTDLTGATSVSFNGTAAKFEVASSSEITTRVPADASTGEVKVVTPNGTLTSNVVFQVP